MKVQTAPSGPLRATPGLLPALFISALHAEGVPPLDSSLLPSIAIDVLREGSDRLAMSTLLERVLFVGVLEKELDNVSDASLRNLLSLRIAGDMQRTQMELDKHLGSDADLAHYYMSRCLRLLERLAPDESGVGGVMMQLVRDGRFGPLTRLQAARVALRTPVGDQARQNAEAFWSSKATHGFYWGARLIEDRDVSKKDLARLISMDEGSSPRVARARDEIRLLVLTHHLERFGNYGEMTLERWSLAEDPFDRGQAVYAKLRTDRLTVEGAIDEMLTGVSPDRLSQTKLCLAFALALTPGTMGVVEQLDWTAQKTSLRTVARYHLFNDARDKLKDNLRTVCYQIASRLGFVDPLVLDSVTSVAGFAPRRQ